MLPRHIWLESWRYGRGTYGVEKTCSGCRNLQAWTWSGGEQKRQTMLKVKGSELLREGKIYVIHKYAPST